MGDHWSYIWPAYAISAAALIGLALAILRRRKRLRARLADLETSDPARENARNDEMSNS